MKRGVWKAALALGLGGLWAEAIGQDSGWRPAARPGAPVTARGVSPSSPKAMLGRPVAITRGASGEPRPFPEAYRYEAPPARAAYGGVEPIATVAPPGAIIAASAPAQVATPPVPAEALELAPTGDLFASDRPALTLVQATLPAPALPAGLELERPGNWHSTFPILPPAVPAEEVAEELPPTRWYVRGEYLLWWIKNDKAPPLVTTTALPVGPNDIFNPGIATLGFPGTVQLFGGELERDPFSGGRFTVGYSFDDCGEKAIELSGFFLGQRSASLVADSFATPVLARPFLRANDRVVLADGTVVGVGPAQSREFVSFPGQATGKVTVSAPSQLWGLEPSLVCKYCCGCDYRIDLLAGFRFLSLSESLSVREDVIFDTGLQRIDQNGMLVPSNLAGARAFVQDRFSTTNQFYGGQVGAEGRWQRDRFTVDGRAKLALGVTRQQLRVDGVTQINNDPQEAGGLLALPSNIGNFSRDCFSVIPQVGVSVGYFLTDQLRATAGYDFLYWSNVARPGGQIDPAIDVTAVPSFRRDPINFLPAIPPRPAHVFKSTDFWAHGLTFGLEYRY